MPSAIPFLILRGKGNFVIQSASNNSKQFCSIFNETNKTGITCVHTFPRIFVQMYKTKIPEMKSNETLIKGYKFTYLEHRRNIFNH